MDSHIKRVEIKEISPIKDRVLVTEMKFKERYSAGGIFIPSDDMKVQGVHLRWGRVYAIGPDQKDVKIGQWILVEHGRWTRGVDIIDTDGECTIRMVDANAIMLVSDVAVVDEVFGRPM